ncbi:hypothetical protein [Rhodopila sp.]|uniref:hypothetical protein n=1 Tax=Rhodopila sp. TaxID=2480087 RepID=UPI003D0AD9EA
MGLIIGGAADMAIRGFCFAVPLPGFRWAVLQGDSPGGSVERFCRAVPLNGSAGGSVERFRWAVLLCGSAAW